MNLYFVNILFHFGSQFCKYMVYIIRFLFSHYLTLMPHALGPHHSTFNFFFFHMQGIEFKKLSSIRDICAINRTNSC